MHDARRRVVITRTLTDPPAQTKASSSVALPERASLLGLPAEVRNAISAFAIEDGFKGMVTSPGTTKLAVKKTSHEQPAICRVNRQLREETLPMFYDHDFSVEIVDLQYAPQPGHHDWQTTREGPSMDFTGENSWPNFKEWLRKYSIDDRVQIVPVFTDFQLAPPLEKFCRPAFRIVKTLAKAGVAWEVVESVLEDYKDVTTDEELFEFWAE